MIADIGAGTGLLTQGLLARGYNVTAIEPNAGMRAAADQLLAGLHGYRSADGAAESIPVSSSSVDLITAAQAFHWFEIERARVEFFRVLRTHGKVALIYSVTSVFGKQMTMVSSPFLFPGLYFAVLFAAFAAVQGLRGMRPAAVWHAVRRRPGVLITMGVLDGVSFLVHSIGVLMAPVAYFIGVKRLSSVVSVVAGGLLFREDHLRTRAAGAFCMVAGVVLLTLRA